MRERVGVSAHYTMSAPKKPPKPTLYLCGLPLSFEASKALRELPKLESLDAVLPVVVADLEGAPPDGEAYRAMQRALSLDADAAAALFTGLHWVVRACMRSNLKAKALAAELADLKVHPPCVEPLVAAVERGRASAARADAAAHAVSLPTLDELRWRLDVSISSGALHRVMRPELTMRCALSDGAEHTFHVPRERLQELRYTAAKLLKDMKDLEMRLATAAGAAPPG